jgi:IMP dehydrogenase
MQGKVNPNYGLSFEDVVIEPGMGRASASAIKTDTKITSRISLGIPFISAGEESVTEAAMAIAMAEAGGIGVIHNNMKPGRQVEEVRNVKRHGAFMIENPMTVFAESSLAEALDLMKNYNVSGLPVVEQSSQKVIGIITKRDVRFADNDAAIVSEFMTTENLAMMREEPTLEDAKKMMHERRIEKLIVLDDQERCRGLITVKDIEKMTRNVHASRDSKGRLRVAASVELGKEGLYRAQALADAEVDVIVVDARHGHHGEALDLVSQISQLQSQKIQIIAGNVVTADGARALIDNGANGIKVGGGYPSISAIMAVSEECAKAGVPVIADCGISASEDITKAIAAGADAVVLNNLLAGTDEAPGEIVYGKRQTYKVTERTNKHDVRRPSYKGAAKKVIDHYKAVMRDGMASAGVESIEGLKYSTRFVQITAKAETA